EAGDVGVVAQRRGQAYEIADPFREGEIVPAVDLVRFDDGARGIVHGAAEADADAAQLSALDATLGEQSRHRLDDLFANAVSAARDIDAAAPQPRETAIAVPQAKLQFRAADFNSEEHEISSPLRCRERGQHFSPLPPGVRDRFFFSQFTASPRAPR